MKIEIHAICHQEAKIIPYFMRHYSEYGPVFLYEGHSTDGSREIATRLGATVIDFDTKNEVRDDLFIDIKNNCWKKSVADWVIICDMDEFVYHPYMTEFLKSVNETVIIPAYFEMMTDKYPTTSGQIYDEVLMGFPIRHKISLFKPKEITDINYGAGCHEALPEGKVKVLRNSGVLCMHMRHLSIDHVVNRNAYLAGRRSQINKDMQWGYHVNFPREEIQKYFDENRKNLVKVMDLVKL